MFIGKLTKQKNFTLASFGTLCTSKPLGVLGPSWLKSSMHSCLWWTVTIMEFHPTSLYTDLALQYSSLSRSLLLGSSYQNISKPIRHPPLKALDVICSVLATQKISPAPWQGAKRVFENVAKPMQIPSGTASPNLLPGYCLSCTKKNMPLCLMTKANRFPKSLSLWGRIQSLLFLLHVSSDKYEKL